MRVPVSRQESGWTGWQVGLSKARMQSSSKIAGGQTPDGLTRLSVASRSSLTKTVSPPRSLRPFAAGRSLTNTSPRSTASRANARVEDGKARRRAASNRMPPSSTLNSLLESTYSYLSMSVGAIGAMPSQFLFDAHGRSVSSAVSAMQPAKSHAASIAAPALISKEHIACLQLVL